MSKSEDNFNIANGSLNDAAYIIAYQDRDEHL